MAPESWTSRRPKRSTSGWRWKGKGSRSGWPADRFVEIALTVEYSRGFRCHESNPKGTLLKGEEATEDVWRDNGLEDLARRKKGDGRHKLCVSGLRTWPPPSRAGRRHGPRVASLQEVCGARARTAVAGDHRPWRLALIIRASFGNDIRAPTRETGPFLTVPGRVPRLSGDRGRRRGRGGLVSSVGRGHSSRGINPRRRA